MAIPSNPGDFPEVVVAATEATILQAELAYQAGDYETAGQLMGGLQVAIYSSGAGVMGLAGSGRAIAGLLRRAGRVDVTNRTPIVTSNGALVRPANSANYSTVTEVQLPTDAYPGISRRRHNQISNQALHEVFEADPYYAAQMENLYPGIVDGVRPGPRGAFPRDVPTPDVTWHHGTTPGQMELVPFDQHTAPGPVQGSLHPGANSGGGFADWGTE